MRKEPPDLRLVVAQAATSAERQAVANHMRVLLDRSGVSGIFDHLQNSGFTITYSEPEKPGLKITAKKDTQDKFKPVSFTLVLTEREDRGPNQPDIHCYSNDRLGAQQLSQLTDIIAEIHRWAFNNLPLIAKSPAKPALGPGANI